MCLFGSVPACIPVNIRSPFSDQPDFRGHLNQES